MNENMNKENSAVWIYDIETLKNVFTYSAINRDTDDVISFVIWKDRNDLPALLKHLDECKGHIGFNNLAFDYPVMHYILLNKKKFLKMDGDKVARLISEEAQKVIATEWAQIRNPYIPQLDLFTIHHFSNPARMTSLKKLEIALKFDNVQDMPIHHTEEVKTDAQIEEILAYNINDIKATKAFYLKSVDKIELRKGIQKKYGINCLNYSDSKIGEELVLKLYCEATGKSPGAVKHGRTYRNSGFRFAECFPAYVKFETKEFNELLERLRGIHVKELKQSFNDTVEYRDLTFYLGTGGIHACIKEGVYESDEENIIVDCDVASLYPSLAVINNIFPQHLEKDFCKVYKHILDERLAAKKAGDMVMANGYKLALNSVYGKSNSEFSFLYDPLYTLKTTLAGQLSLCMLSEMLFVGIPELKMLQANTDGITVVIPRSKRRDYLNICQKWQEITSLELEYVAYDKMIIRDVNNYIAISTDKKTGKEKVKHKGTFKPHEQMMKDGEYYKAFNQGIVPIAISDYFLKGIPVEETVKNHKNIYDFCKTFAAKGKFTCETYNLDENGNEVNVKEAQKTIRYYVSTNGDKFRKRGEPLKPKYMNFSFFSDRYRYDRQYIYTNHEEKFNSLKSQIDLDIDNLIANGTVSDRAEVRVTIHCDAELYKLLSLNFSMLNNIFQVSSVEVERSETFNINYEKDWRLIDVEAGDYLVTIFNQYEEKPMAEYNINYDYYIEECNKIIDTVTGEKERVLMEKKLERENEKMQREERDYIQFCINKVPTQRQFDLYKRDWLTEKYGQPKEIKPTRGKIKDDNNGDNNQSLGQTV